MPPQPQPPRPSPPPPGGGGGGAGPGVSGAHQAGQQRLVFRLVNAGDSHITNAQLEMSRVPGRVIVVPLRDDGMLQLDQPADGVLVGVDSGPYVRLLQARLWVDQPQGRTLAWEGVLSVPDRYSDGAAWTVRVDKGALVAHPIAALPAGDTIAGLVGGYPLAGLTFWGVFLLVYVAAMVALGRRAPAAP